MRWSDTADFGEWIPRVTFLACGLGCPDNVREVEMHKPPETHSYSVQTTKISVTQ